MEEIEKSQRDYIFDSLRDSKYAENTIAAINKINADEIDLDPEQIKVALLQFKKRVSDDAKIIFFFDSQTIKLLYFLIKII